MDRLARTVGRAILRMDRRPFGFLRDSAVMISQIQEPEAIPSGNDSMPELPDGAIKDLVQLFKLLSDETRLRILFYLSHRDELHVRALCELLEQSQPAVSHHLALLRVAGLIEPRREGKHNFYHIQKRRFEHLIKLFFAAVPEGDVAQLKSRVLGPELNTAL